MKKTVSIIVLAVFFGLVCTALPAMAKKGGQKGRAGYDTGQVRDDMSADMDEYEEGALKARKEGKGHGKAMQNMGDETEKEMRRQYREHGDDAEHMEDEAGKKGEKVKERATEMNRKGFEKQKEKKMAQEQKELGKGSEQGQEARQNRKKWWKFWE